jgi:carbon starvation protein
MSAVLPVLICFALYVVGYRFYARFLSDKLFTLDDSVPTPAHRFRDDVDYVPTQKPVLFGHHYASIAGLAPMLGPAVAVIWGWLPAMLWVVLGSLLIGCVHDFSALVLSLRARGLSIGAVAEGVVGRRAMTLFHLIIFFGVALAMGVFVFVISKLFSVELGPGHPGYPQAVAPSALIMVVALIVGFAVHRRGMPRGVLTSMAFLLVLVSIPLSMKARTLGLPSEAWPGSKTWIYLLMVYAMAACVLPVWSLLQPRDFINSLLLYLGLGLCYIGIFVGRPEFAAPAINPHPEGAPSIFPFVFIVIACGAVSGFHGLVSSGTTGKQLDRESDARPIGYGGMIGESLLGLLAVVATTAGFAGPEVWHTHYQNWGKIASSLPAKLDGFIGGCATFLQSLGIPNELGASFMAIIVVSFALTTLDSATRILRFNIEEMVRSLRLPRILAHRYVASLAAVLVILGFATLKVGGKPVALALWTLFGTTNQLLAGLTLLVATLYLRQRGRSWWYTGLPMLYMMATTLTAMVKNLIGFATPGGPNHSWLLATVGGILLVLALWLCVEAFLSLSRDERIEGLAIPVQGAAQGIDGES